MPLDFTPTSVVKSAKRTFTAPITEAQTFDEAIAALSAEENPLGATDYMTAGETISGVTTTSEYYKATIEITQAYGSDASANRNSAKDSWNVRLKIHDPTGEIYYLAFTRKDLKISSYESDDILAKVDTWADGVAALN